MIISPSMLSSNIGKLEVELQALAQAGIEWVHWDVMDGRFVPNITFGQDVIKSLRAKSALFFDVHLMIVEPERYIADFCKAGADMLVVHAEATIHLQRVLAEIRSYGVKAGVAINPATPLSVVKYVVPDVDMVLVMSVNPGFCGQSFLPITYEKIQCLRDMLTKEKSSALIQVDGGVTPENAKKLISAGADVLVSGSAFFKNSNYKESRKAFEALMS